MLLPGTESVMFLQDPVSSDLNDRWSDSIIMSMPVKSISLGASAIQTIALTSTWGLQ